MNLELLGKGITGYHAAYGELPPGVFVGPNGDKHSWRTLVIPYILSEQHAAHYCFDLPWNSQNNCDALRDFFDLFVHRCPLDPSPAGPPFNTSYVMLVRAPVEDPETGMASPALLATDAVLVVESIDCGIQFAEPRDLPWEDLWKGDSAFGKSKLNSLHPGVVTALRVDGQVIDVPKDITREDLRKLLRGTATNRKEGGSG
jgi:hypothetical protein